MFSNRRERALQVSRALTIRLAKEGEFVGCDVCIGNKFGGIDLEHSPQAMTAFAGAISGVERKGTWLERRYVDATNHARHFLGIKLLFAVNHRHQHRTAG